MVKMVGVIGKKRRVDNGKKKRKFSVTFIFISLQNWTVSVVKVVNVILLNKLVISQRLQILKKRNKNYINYTSNTVGFFSAVGVS